MDSGIADACSVSNNIILYTEMKTDTISLVRKVTDEDCDTF